MLVLAVHGLRAARPSRPRARAGLPLRAADAGGAVRVVRANAGRALGAVRRDAHARDRPTLVPLERPQRPSRESRRRPVFPLEGAGPKSLVVVMPIWGTSDYPPAEDLDGLRAPRRARRARHLDLRQRAAVSVDRALARRRRRTAFGRMARDSAERYRSAVVDMRRLVDWAATQPEIDASRIAFVGFSMSALVTATLLANEPRIAGGVLMMGAARFADVFALCRQPRRRSARARHAQLRLDHRRVPRVLQGTVRPRRSRALRGPLRSDQDPHDRRDVRRLHAGIVARGAVGDHGPSASA